MPALADREGCPVLVGLEGRTPVVFRNRSGQPINNVDVSAALRPFALAQFQLHQAANGDLRLRVGSGLSSHPDRAGVGGGLRAALLALFGADQPLIVEQVDALDEGGGKLAPYTT